ncbi:hypothetical protein EJ03DRAFT_348990 [Teratosphaeria nubilosa]|uniref:Amino acid permease/ SLC12A domain-containing protein n=1 Tax=Teratosphaeria nubilosa TaxID=161662 RepID=A0A6G1LHZ5_9PEZI|nr:hypothetical protein EJ03DRAFT_348990 [Teratosphaeria nubilosa]
MGFCGWKHPGPIANGINGFGQCFLQAAVCSCGTEMLALTAAESKNPASDLPRAIKSTLWRFLVIFIGLVLFAGIIVSVHDAGPVTAEKKFGKSPWTIASTHAGVPQMGNVIIWR